LLAATEVFSLERQKACLPAWLMKGGPFYFGSSLLAFCGLLLLLLYYNYHIVGGNGLLKSFYSKQAGATVTQWKHNYDD